MRENGVYKRKDGRYEVRIGISGHKINLSFSCQIVQHSSCTKAVSVSAEISAGRDICRSFFTM